MVVPWHTKPEEMLHVRRTADRLRSLEIERWEYRGKCPIIELVHKCRAPCPTQPR